MDDVSAISHNVVVIRLLERSGRYDRMLSIMKMRDSDYDRSIRELMITRRGIVVAPRRRTLRGRVVASVARKLAKGRTR
jgi:circadian clock protein KaiC